MCARCSFHAARGCARRLNPQAPLSTKQILRVRFASFSSRDSANSLAAMYIEVQTTAVTGSRVDDRPLVIGEALFREFFSLATARYRGFLRGESKEISNETAGKVERYTPDKTQRHFTIAIIAG